jgi:hypothetical protein
MTDHHTKTTPHIPIPTNHQLTKCGPAIERRIRELLTWHAGGCGLITDEAKDRVARMFFDGTLTLTDLRKLASRAVYQECVLWIDAIVSMRKADQ